MTVNREQHGHYAHVRFETNDAVHLIMDDNRC
jgi:hypothetical protein